jgi:hypothetical protein
VRDARVKLRDGGRDLGRRPCAGPRLPGVCRLDGRGLGGGRRFRVRHGLRHGRNLRDGFGLFDERGRHNERSCRGRSALFSDLFNRLSLRGELFRFRGREFFGRLRRGVEFFDGRLRRKRFFRGLSLGLNFGR